MSFIRPDKELHLPDIMPLNNGISNDKNFGRFTSKIERNSKLSSGSSGKSALFLPHATSTVFTALIPEFEFDFCEFGQPKFILSKHITVVVMVLCGQLFRTKTVRCNDLNS